MSESVAGTASGTVVGAVDARSADLRSRAAVIIPGGVDSNVRLDRPGVFFERGVGARLYDVDGRDYVDYLLGQGPSFLGHVPERVQAAVEAATRSGLVFGAQHALEVEAAERFLAATRWPQMVRFGMTGTEMDQAAFRLARAATRREKFVRFAGHYHGWLDNVLLAVRDGVPGPASEGQLPSSLAESFVLTWNDADALERLLADHGHEIAAVIMEPIMFNTGSILPRPGYLERVRAACDAHGVILIFDEVISGFRVALGGAVERLGVIPDLAVYGKAIAAGWPTAALAGRADLMERFGTGSVNHSGTANANVMSMAATVAAIETLTDDPPYERLESFGDRLMDGLRAAGARHGHPLNVQGLPMAFNASVGGPAVAHDHLEAAMRDGRAYDRVADALVAAGVWVARRGIWYVSAAHGEEELELTLARIDAALEAVMSAE